MNSVIKAAEFSYYVLIIFLLTNGCQDQGDLQKAEVFKSCQIVEQRKSELEFKKTLTPLHSRLILQCPFKAHAQPLTIFS